MKKKKLVKHTKKHGLLFYTKNIKTISILLGIVFLLLGVNIVKNVTFSQRVLGISTGPSLLSQFFGLFNKNVLGASTISDAPHMVDQFGQYTGGTWQGKVTTASDIIQNRNKEKYLAKPFDRDDYGGYTAISITNNTGSFSVGKLNGRWFFVDPQGHPFYSIGMDVVTNTNATVVGGREQLFSNAQLPSVNSSDPLTKFYGKYDGKLTYDFYKANLYRANNNNANFQSDWENRMYNRLFSWGFNTLANWSDSNLYAEKKMPYMVAIDSYLYTGHIPKMIQINSSTSMPDVFDKSFADTTAYGMQVRGKLCTGNPFCIGVFVDNEVPFNGSVASNKDALVRAVLMLSQKFSQAKYYFTNRLKIKYSTIQNLNTAWNTHFASWDEFANKSVTIPNTLNDKQTVDVKKMMADYAYKYFAVVSNAVHTYIPNKLYLGPRFLTFDEPIEAIYGCGYYCDVVSFNEYRSTLTGSDLAIFSKLNKPILIGEFHFTASDRGLSQDYLMGVGTQEARARGYAAYVNSALSLPLVVGFGWFQYLDEPLTDRISDKEDYNVGFVTITDTVYTELVNAATQINRSIYQKLFSNTTPSVIPTPTLAAGCYYSYQCMGVASTKCQQVVVCPTDVPSSQGQTLSPQKTSGAITQPTSVQIANPTSIPTSTTSKSQGTSLFNLGTFHF